MRTVVYLSRTRREQLYLAIASDVFMLKYTPVLFRDGTTVVGSRPHFYNECLAHDLLPSVSNRMYQESMGNGLVPKYHVTC